MGRVGVRMICTACMGGFTARVALSLPPTAIHISCRPVLPSFLFPPCCSCLLGHSIFPITINSPSPPPPAPLPSHSSPLLQLSLPEREFLGSLNPLSIQLLQAGARGVYQDQLPLDLAAALDLGCCVRVAPAARARPWSAGYDLKELQVGMEGAQGGGGIA